MKINNKCNSKYFENYEDLFSQMLEIFLRNVEKKNHSINKENLGTIFKTIIDNIEKGFYKGKNRNQYESKDITRALLSVFEKKNAFSYNFDQKIQILIACRKVLIENIISINYDGLIEGELTQRLWSIFDQAILNLCGKYDSENTINTRRKKSTIDNLKIVKNDLQKQLNLSYQLIKNTPVGLVGCDPELKIKIWNSIAEDLTGYQQSDVIGQSVLSIFTQSSQNVLHDQLSAHSGRKKRMRLNIQTKDGGIINAHVLVSRLKSEMKQKVQYIINIIDLSKDELLKSQLEKIEQLSAIARLSDAMMHDIRNPINALSLNIDVLTQFISEQSSSSERMHKIIDSINRQIANLNQNLNRYVGYSRITELKLEPIDIRDPINELILDTQSIFKGKRIELKYHRSKNKMMINGDRNQLLRVFRNLLDNSIDAIGDTGKINIYMRKRTNNVTISIVDSGQGIKSENLHNVFKPYFTTKDKGSGLGLFIVREIVRAHHGKVYCTSSDELGTRFTVSIPAIVK